MTLLVIIFGLMSGTLLAVLVGLLGRSRQIGFGLAFLLSIIFTPLVGLIITLLTPTRADGGDSGVGCIGFILGAIALVMMAAVALLLLGILVV